MKPRLMHVRTPTEQPSPRMEALARLPIFITLEGRRALVAGGTPAAAWKAELLSAAGAAVDVYAAEVCEELLTIAGDVPNGAITLHRRAWQPEDLSDAVDRGRRLRR